MVTDVAVADEEDLVVVEADGVAVADAEVAARAQTRYVSRRVINRKKSIG